MEVMSIKTLKDYTFKLIKVEEDRYLVEIFNNKDKYQTVLEFDNVVDAAFSLGSEYTATRVYTE